MGKREWSSVLVAIMLAACAGDSGDEADTPADTGAMAPPVAPPATPPAGGAATLPAGVTPEMVAQGKTLFEGGICIACHGQDANGLPQLAPSLRDAVWLNTDGSYDGIVTTIKTGVAAPKEHQNAMPPMGGGQFTDEQVRALAAFVYSISHGG
jgi:mono/diheme cytochrome c family protein